MHAAVAGADVKLRLDISTGDPVAPPLAHVDYPTLLPRHPSVRVLGYPLPVVLAEKLCTAVELGAGNSRVRDYADVSTLTRAHDVPAADLLTALAATSQHRGVGLRPLRDLLHDYGTARASAFEAHRRRLGPDAAKLPGSFAVVVQDVAGFADPALSGTDQKIWGSNPFGRTRWNRCAATDVGPADSHGGAGHPTTDPTDRSRQVPPTGPPGPGGSVGSRSRSDPSAGWCPGADLSFGMRSRRGAGSVRERRPGVWEVRVALGPAPSAVVAAAAR